MGTSAFVTDVVEPTKVAAREKLREMKATALSFTPVVTSGWRPVALKAHHSEVGR
jgi:hypothetical protein